MPTKLTIPISEADIRGLHVGDSVLLDGVMVTGRDAAHKYIVETFIKSSNVPETEKEVYAALKQILAGGVIYHCGPVVKKLPNPQGASSEAKWAFVAAGPTTSIREEPYQADVIGHFGLRAVIGKGGMATKTLEGCQKYGAVYLHAIGGAATLIADRVKEVLAVYKKDEFGVPEAFWVIRVQDFPAVVTMDAHGKSLHAEIKARSQEKLAELSGA
jgi:fumarate hydratase class I